MALGPFPGYSEAAVAAQPVSMPADGRLCAVCAPSQPSHLTRGTDTGRCGGAGEEGGLGSGPRWAAAENSAGDLPPPGAAICWGAPGTGLGSSRGQERKPRGSGIRDSEGRGGLARRGQQSNESSRDLDGALKGRGVSTPVPHVQSAGGQSPAVWASSL